MRKSILIIFLALISAHNAYPQHIFNVIASGNLKLLNETLDQNPNLLNFQTEEGYNPVHIACVMAKREPLKVLLERGADPNLTNKWGKGPLHLAASEGYVDIVELLVINGAVVNSRDKKSWTPLRWAIFNGRTEVAEWLIKNNAETDFPEYEYGTLIHEAASCGCKDLLNSIVGKAGFIHSLNKSGGTLLHSAAQGGLDDLIEELFKSDFDIDAIDYYGLTPLHRAAYFNQEASAQKLISLGVKLNAKCFGGKTPYNYAKVEGHSKIIELLISAGADTSDAVLPQIKGEYLGMKPPGIEPESFAPGIISTIDGSEFAGTFTPDGIEFFFTYRKPGVSGNRIFYTNGKNGNWIKPDLAPFASGTFEYEPHISHDGQRLFFGSKRQNPIRKNDYNYGWVVKKANNEWGGPEFIDTTVNNAWPMYFGEAANRTLYYTGNKRRGIYRSKFLDGKYLEPQRLPDEEINYLFSCAHPYIAPDESYIIFDARDERKNSDDTDLYISFRIDADTWTKAINMGSPVNFDTDEIAASVSPNGKYLFFKSDRMGSDDIFWVDAKVIEELRPESLR